jgi:hypothetical protein
MTTVLMQFGDGSHKTIEIDNADPDKACEEARDWVSDNAWYEVQDENGNVTGHCEFRDMSRW